LTVLRRGKMARKHARRLASREALISVALSLMGCLLAGCIDSWAYGIAWEDANCNGVQDSGETALQGVCVWSSWYPAAPTPAPEDCNTEYFQTEADGEFGPWWYSGAACKEIFIFAQTPDGYQPTTDIAVNGCSAEFGFARESTCPERRVMTQAELTKRQTIKKLASYLVWFLVLPGAAIGIGVLLLKRQARPTR
jgi:hypothetical protein